MRFKYEIIFFDGHSQRCFEFGANSDEEALIRMNEILRSDGFKPNNQSKIIVFRATELEGNGKKRT